jgi:transposase
VLPQVEIVAATEAYSTGLDQLARALKNWSDSRKGARKGRRVGFPRFKSRRRHTPSVRFTTGAKLRLSERTYVCTACGLVLDRDENAAINLASLVKRVVAGSGPETQNGRGADRKTRPVRAGGSEASTPHRAVPARIRRGPSPSNGRITEIH